MKKKTSFRSNPHQVITAIDLQKRHPWNQVYLTDFAYTHLANHIYSVLEKDLEFMGKEATIQVALGMTLYMEDLISDTHQMEAFLRLYKQRYGYFLPFYETKGEDDPAAELDKMRFVLWHCSCAERHGSVLNPMNFGITNMAEKLVEVYHSATRDFGCVANEDLLDFLYAQETLDDPVQLKTVIMWLESESFLGRWHNNRPEDDEYHFEQIASTSQKSLVRYANMSVAAFDHQAWPLSLPAKSAYAEMLRIDSGDSDDPDAQQVEAIEFVGFCMMHVEGERNGMLLVSDFKGRQYEVDPQSSSINLLKQLKNNNAIASALFKYRDRWNVCGANGLVKIPDNDLQKAFEKVRQQDHIMHDFVGQYDNFIQAHGGQRIFFVKDINEYRRWTQKELGMSNSELLDQLMESCYMDDGYTIFFEENGQISFSHTAAGICHSDNPYYSDEDENDTDFAMVINEGYCSPGLLEYSLRNNLLPDASLKDYRGDEYGWQLMQENIDFLARCFRRDITKQEVFCPRRKVVLHTSDEAPWLEDSGRIPFKAFLTKISNVKVFVSPANKHWKLVKATQEVVSIKDDRGKVVEIDTDGLYDAYYFLESYDYVIDNIKNYVPRNQASAALAVLHTVFGNGVFFSNMRSALERLGGLEGLAEFLRNNRN